MAGRPDLKELAERVSEGSAVDWESAEKAAASEEQRDLIRQLRLLDRLARFHRRQGGADPGGQDPKSLSVEVDLDTLTHTQGPEGAGAAGTAGLAPGQILGERYRIESLLGRGGMGEVWRAHDLKLRLDVALKSLLRDSFADEQAFELIRHEVRAAREVVSPNVCRIFDLAEADGRELVSMEYIDGVTLLELLRQGPLELREAGEIAAQFLAGLEAIHQAGLVHRDVKPENVMITRAGRVVLMDFGIATRKSDGVSGLRVGTPAYMSPEQERGEAVDARTDVYAAGLVLAELVCAEGLSEESTRQTLWKALRHDPPAIPEGPWRRILLRAIAKDADDRFESAATLSRALEEVAFRVEGAEDKTPYPGLSSFTEIDAEFFFGREAEVESVWKKLDHTSLLGVIGASGSGKSSFVRAGLIPAKPDGWGHAICQPGNGPFAALGQALLPELKGDDGAVRELIGLEDPKLALSAIGRWRKNHDEALLIVDQFEELFTQNPEDVQSRFAKLLGRVALDTDVHVLLAMRDDFLLHCHDHEALAPVFSELTPLKPPTGPELRRAMIQPALACGYRFEDEAAVEEMLGEVTRERGALPLIAFTAAQLWEHRDREAGLLTREAYDGMGGVGGALARHAEATLAKIGKEHEPIVREFFRNLVTAQGTRAARDVEELLSVFVVSEALARESGAEYHRTLVARSTALGVLQTLIDARLLTSFEVPGEDGEGVRRRVEIIHESLLTSWPRLVRWQSQDAESAQLRDELRQAAGVWDKHGRPDDLLWTGTSFREFQLWRERYPGGLTSTEEAFAGAMTTLAERRKRRRRLAVSSVIAALLIVVVVIGGFWRRSVVETRRAEAASVFSLAQLWLEDHPTAAIAYATASLELADSAEARRLAIEALWRGPQEFRVPDKGGYALDFSPDGRWLVTDSGVLWPADGGPTAKIEGTDVTLEGRISPRGDVIAYILGRECRQIGLSSFPEGRFLRSFTMGGAFTQIFRFSRDGERLITSTEVAERSEVWIRSWPVAGGNPDLVARLEYSPGSTGTYFGVDPAASRVAWVDGSRFHLAPVEGTTVDPVPTATLEHERAIATAVFDESARQLATADLGGTIKVWSLERAPPELTRTLRDVGTRSAKSLRFDSSGSMLGSGGMLVWNLAAAPDAEPLRLLRAARAIEGDTAGRSAGVAFDPGGRWFATGHSSSISFWPLSYVHPQVLPGHERGVGRLAFTPDGRRLVSTSEDGSLRIWPLGSRQGERSRVLLRSEGPSVAPASLAMAPDGSAVAIGDYDGRVRVVPLDGGPARELTGIPGVVARVAVGPGVRLVAGSANAVMTSDLRVRVWDLATGETRILDVGDGKWARHLEFTGRDELLVASGSRFRLWDLEGSAPRVREEIEVPGLIHDLSPDRHQALFVSEDRRLWLYDVDTQFSLELTSHGAMFSTVEFGPTGAIVVSGDPTGAIRVGAARGGEPHLLLGHEGGVRTLAVSPDGRWIASGGDDGLIRLWPMPNLAKPPLHTLPREELLAKLRSLTNLRAVADPDSPNGWKLEIGPFPGWETVPTW